MKKTLITGITGFVGSNLKPYLEKPYEVKGVSRKGKANTSLLAYTDLSKQELDTCEAFVHLAGKAHDLKNTSEQSEYFKVNTELTKTLFDKFLESDCAVFIYMSSVKAVADTVEGELKETATPNPVTPYGKSKLEAEKYLLGKSLPENKRLYILRPGMIHGPNNKGNLNLLYKLIEKGIPYPLGAFENRRSFVSVENLCFIIKNLIEKKPASGAYHIADDPALSTRELVKIIGEASGKKAKIINIPQKGVRLIAKVGDSLHLPLNTERLGKLTENYVISNTKIKAALGIKQLPLSAAEGLTKTIKSFKNTK